MPIIPWRPFWDIERWFAAFGEPRLWREEEWPELWEWPRFRFPEFRRPRMNISETEKDVITEVELPGVDPKDIEVEVGDNFLKVQAKKKEEKEERKKGYYKKEISAGFYKRVVPLPVEVVGEKAKAEYADGILKIVIPKVVPKKTEKKKAVKVKVKGAKTA